MLKRALSLLLAFVMVFSLLPVNALAEETAPDEGESLLLEPAEIAEEEPETIPPSETEEKNIIEETEEAPVPETQAPTVPETAPETVPETVPETAPETQPETVPETEPEQLLDAAGEAESVLAENSTWILNETKELTLSGTNNPFGSDAPNYTFTFTPTEYGRYIFYWPSEDCHGNGPHVVVKDSEGRQYGNGNVYADFYGDAGNVYTVEVYSCYDGEYTANITLANSTDSGSIYFQETSISGYVGQRSGRRVYRYPDNYAHGLITWESSNENIVRITNSQFSALEFEMVGPGEATITATDAHGQSASFTVIVADIDAVDIQLDSTVTGTIPAESSVYYRFTAPETGKYIIQLDYQDGYVPNTTVECGGIRIAGDGSDRVQFSAEAGKEYIITMENWQGTEMGLSFRLMQAVRVQSIELGYYPLTNGFVGEELGFSATVSPENADIESLTWESSDESVVSIGERYGLYQSVNLVGPGTATVTVYAPDCTPLEITYTVSAVSGSIALNGTFTAGLQRDEKTAFYFTPDTDGNYTVYETGGMDSYIEVYEISEIGNWHNGSGNGSATFWANAGDKCLIVGQACQYEPYEYTYCVAEAVEPTGISLSPASYTGYVGETFYPDVKAEPANAIDPEVQWSSSNPDVASVTGGGRVRLRKAGTATITAATSGDNPLTATCTVTVKAPVALTVGSTKTVTLPAGSSVGYQFTAPGNYSYTFWDQNFGDISLTVSDSNGDWITGGSIGKFAAEKGETYLICVTSESTESQICKFIIKQDVNATSISLPYTSEIAAVGDEFELWVGFSPINAIHEDITFTLDNDCAEILEQQPYGYIRVKMNQVGTVKLTATSETTKHTASCTFTITDGAVISVDDSMHLTLEPEGSLDVKFTVPTDGNYVLWCDDNLSGWPHIEVLDQNGASVSLSWLRNSFTAKQGQTYTAHIFNYSSDVWDFDLFLHKAVTDGELWLNETEVTIPVGVHQGVELWTAYPYSDRTKVTWKSANTSVVKIVEGKQNDCQFVGLKPGTTTITVSDGYDHTDQLTVHVVSATVLTEGEPVTQDTFFGEEKMFTFTPKEDGSYVIRYVNNQNSWMHLWGPDVDLWNHDWLQADLKAGQPYGITATTWDDTISQVTYIVEKAETATGVHFQYPSYSGFVGERIDCKLYYEPDNGKFEDMVFTLNGDEVGYDRVGMSLYLSEPGTFTLTATSTSNPNLTASCTIVVKAPEDWPNEYTDVSFENGESQAYWFTAEEEGMHVLSNLSESFQPIMRVFDSEGYQVTESWGEPAYFYALENETYLIKLDPNTDESYTASFRLGIPRSFDGISIPLWDPMECNVNEIIEGGLIYLDGEEQINDHELVEIQWTADSGLQILDGYSNYFRVKTVEEGTHTLTATVLDEHGEPTDISASVTFEIGPKPAAFTDGKRVVQAHWMQPYSFTAPASGDYTMWTNSDEWVVFEIVDLVENRSIGYGDNLLHCSLQKGRNYTVYVVNRNDYQITVDAFLRKDVAPTGIRISGDTEQRFVGENVYLYADGEPTNSTLNNVQWEIIAGNADIESNGTECVITPKDAGNITVKATSGSVSGECTFTVRESNIWNLDSSKSLTMNGWEPVVYQFTAPADSGYIVWEDNSDRTWIEVCNQQGEYLGMSGGGFCQFDAKEGQTYRIKLWANSDEAYEAAFHLETLTEPTGIKPLYGSKITGYVGDEIFLPLAFTPGNAARGQISWASSNTDVVEVVEDEYVNGYACSIRLNAPGEATITATHQRVDGVSTEFHIKVLDVDTIALDIPVSVTLEGHESTAAYDFTAPSSGTYVIYDETNQYGSVEVVFDGEYFWGDNRVQFTAQKGQTYRVVFHHWDDWNEKGEVTYSYVLTKAAPATGIRLSEEHLSGLPGDTRYLNVLGEPVNADLSGLTWSIDNKAVAVLVGENATNREIQLVGQGTATVTVRLGDLEVNCPITVGAEREAILVGDSKTVHLKHMETVGFAFTPDLDGDYYFYEASRDWVTIVVWSEDGRWVDGTGDGRVRILDAKAGTTYYITVTNDMYGVAGVAKDFTLHLEEAVKATGISLSKTGIDTRYAYPGDKLWVIAYSEPLNGYQGQLEWSVSEEYKNYVAFVEEEYDPRGDGLCLEIDDNAPAGTMVVTCTDTETGLSATLNIVIKSIKSILLGKNYSVTQHNQENDLATFTPEEDGTYILKASTDVIVWVYTDDEDIHTPDGPETEMLLELKAGVTYNVESVLLGEDGNMTAGDYDLRIIQDGINPLSFTSDHISIEQNTTKSLGLSVEPEALSDLVTYKSSDAAIVKVDENGEITTSETPGSAYITATLTFGSRTFTAVCRVDVISDDEIKGAQFSTTAPTVELYKSSYTTITAVPYKEITEGRSTIKESVNSPITKVEFDSENSDYTTLNSLFDLEIAGSQTVRIVPKQEEIDKIFNGALSVKSSYTVKLTFTFNDDVTVTTPFKLTIKKTVPTLKASKLAFNSFITGDTRSIVLTGGIVERIYENEDMQDTTNNALNSWLDLNDDTLSLKPGITGKKSGNVYLYVDVAGWSVPAKVTVPVSVAYTAPSLKLSATSVTVSSSNSKGIDLKLLCGKKGQTLEQLEVNGISVDESEVEFIRENFDLETGSFTLLPTDQYAQKTKSVTLWVSFTNTSERYSLTVKVTPKDATLAAKPASVKLNAYRGDSAVIGLAPSPADYKLESLEDLDLTLYKVVNRQNVETDDLDVEFYDGALHVSTTDGTALGTTYKLVINAKGNANKTTTITLTTLTEKQSVITASAKITGSVDLTFPESYAVIQPTFTNYTNGDYALIDFEITNSKGVAQEGYDRFFRLENVAGQYRLSVANPEDQPAPGTYYLRPFWELGDGSSPDKTGVVKFTVKRTAVSLKASATKIILNKDIGDWATVDISCLTKGYDLVDPIVKVIAPKGVSSESLTATYENGMLLIETTGDTPYGKTFTVSIKARNVKEDKELKVSAVIPKQGSKVGATLKTKGTIDLVRDTTSVVITPSYTNYSGQGGLEPKLTIQKYEVGDKKYENGKDVTDEEFYIDNNDDGTFTVTRVPGANIDLKQYKYRAEMTFAGKSGIDNLHTIPAVALPLKSNTVKATVSGTPVLYKADKYSRASFRLNIADATVNAIEAVESTNPLYQIEDYGNGEYAICFNTSSWTAATKYPTSVTLNVFLDGNENAATKVTLKLSLK